MEKHKIKTVFVNVLLIWERFGVVKSSSNLIVSKFLQSQNIPSNFSTFVKSQLSKSRLWSDEQFENILLILITLEVLKLEISNDDKDEQL